jgi:hypothetical protein
MRKKKKCIQKMELVQTGSGQHTEEVRTGLQPMRMKVKCTKTELVQAGSDQYTEEVQTGLQPLRMKEKCIFKKRNWFRLDLANI